jgi:hypothetical protein
MNLITVIIIALVIWLVYSLIQSYRNLEKELKEIRAKCINMNNPAQTKPSEPIKETTKDEIIQSELKDAKNLTDVSDGTVNNKIPPNKLTPNTVVNKNYIEDKQSGAYTSTGEEIYVNNSSDPYSNDPIVSIKNNLVHGLQLIKDYSAI